MKNLYKLLAIMLVALTPFAAFAENITGQGLDYVISDIFTQACSVKNASFLRYMFAMYGTVICFEDGSVTLLTKIIGFVNVIAMAFMIVLSTWFFLTGIIKTATEGEVLGKSWSTVWMPIRLSAGVALIMPSSGMSGFLSVAQAFIFQLILAGSMCANILWHGSIDSLLQDRNPGGNSANYVGQAAEFAGKFQVLTCMESKRRDNPSQKIVYTYQGVNGSTSGAINGLAKIRTASLPYDDSVFDKLQNVPNIRKLQFGNDCGEHKFEWNSKAQWTSKSGDDLSASDLVEKRISFIAPKITKAVLADYKNIQAFAKKAVADTGEGGLGNSENYVERINAYNSKPETAPEIPQFAREYLTTMDRSATKIVNSTATDPSTDVTEWGKQAKARGWIFAGQIYSDLPLIENIQGSIISSTVGQITLPDVNDCDPEEEDIIDKIATGWSCAPTHERFSKYMIAPKLTKDASQRMGELEPAIANKYGNITGPTIGNAANPDEISYGALAWILQLIVPDGTSMDIYGTTNGGTALDKTSGDRLLQSTKDPITATQGFGIALETTYTALKVVQLITGFNADMLKTFGIDSSFTTQLLMSALDEVTSYLKIGAFIFSYYLPLLPLMTWVSAIFVIFKITTQALVAFPLSIVQMMNPEGEGISGTRMERSWALLAAVFLRPSLCVIALFCSIKLSIVTYSFFQTMFWSGIGIGFSYIAIVAVIGSYLVSLVAITKQSVWIINEMPEVVLNWFSSGVGGAFGSAPQEVMSTGDVRDSAARDNSNGLTAEVHLRASDSAKIIKGEEDNNKKI